MDITHHDKEMLQIMRDPVKWAKHHLSGDEPRWYQEQILRHPHNRKVLRCGRRIGKCIEATQRVVDPGTGEYESVEELFRRQGQKGRKPKLLTLDEQYLLKQDDAFFIEDNGVKEVFRVRTKGGAEVLLTGNHPVLTIDGWVQVDLLEIGESIAVPKHLHVEGRQKADEASLRHARILGHLVSGGRITRGELRYKGSNEVVAEALAGLFAETGAEMKALHGRKQTYRIDGAGLELFEAMVDVEEERMPREVFGYDREMLVAFLGGLYDAGGWRYAKRIVEFGYATRSRVFARELKHILLRLGVRANLVERELAGDPYYHVMVCQKDQVLALADMLDAVGASVIDHAEIRAKARHMKDGELTLPKAVWRYIENERVEKKMARKDVTGNKNERMRTNINIGYRKARRYAENLRSAFLHDLVNADVAWEEVVSIESVGERQTYDVFVPETHNLVVEDILVHNTWTMTAHMLWVAYTCNGGKETKKGATCLVATPYDTQAREIFDQLNNFIKNSEALRASVEAIRKSPYEIVFKNGSRIKLYTAGTRSGAEGGSLRGQKASWLYLDRLCPCIG